MKRFWTVVSAAPADDGWGIRLDGRAVRTPARAPLILPTERLADAIAAEWAAVGDTVDPRAMPMTGFANAAIDRIAPDLAAFARALAAYGETDLLYYRADRPSDLVARQRQRWDPLLDWARRRYDVDFRTTAGISHVAQPGDTIAKLGHAVAALDPFALAGLAPLVTIGGSLIAALGISEGAIPVETAWDSVTVDEQWNFERWGSDREAEAMLESRRRDFAAGARWLRLLAD